MIRASTYVIYSKGYKYVLEKDLVFNVPLLKGFEHKSYFITLIDGVLTLKKGYAWNGASGPTRDTPSTMRGSAGHDALYQLISEGSIGIQQRGIIDDYFKQWILEDGMSRIRAWYFHYGVVKAGRRHALAKKKIYSAP